MYLYSEVVRLSREIARLGGVNSAQRTKSPRQSLNSRLQQSGRDITKVKARAGKSMGAELLEIRLTIRPHPLNART